MFMAAAMLMLGIAAGVSAQTVREGSLRPLLGVRAMSVNMDFSKTMVEGLRLKDYMQDLYYAHGVNCQAQFDKDARKMLAEFVEEFNDVDAPLMLTVSRNAPLHMTVVVKEVSRKGNIVKCDYVISKNRGPQVAVIEMTSKEGRVGSFINLMGDAFEEAGEDMGKFIKRMLKKEQKKSWKERKDKPWNYSENTCSGSSRNSSVSVSRSSDGTRDIYISCGNIALDDLADMVADALDGNSKAFKKHLKRAIKEARR